MEQKKGFIKGALCGALVVLLLSGTLTGFGRQGIVDGKTERKLQKMKTLVDKYYLHEGEYEEEDLDSALLKGYVSGLKDPYSVYYDERETRELMEMTSGEYSGIGAVMSQNIETGIVTINTVYKDSPAAEAGLKDGDILYKVEGKEISGRDLNAIVKEIKGKEGTEVSLTVIRGEDRTEVKATAKRRKIEAQTVEYEMKKGKIGYMRITEFDDVTTKQFEQALEELQAQGMKGLTVDLRSNPGGSLKTVCEILDRILPKGTIVYTEDKNGKRETYTSDDKRQLRIPMTVLVDGRSASASEIFAGAVQDYGAATLVGTKTYGKGVVQQIFDLRDGTALKLTISEYFTPKGRSINGKGIAPDVEVKYEPDEKNPEADNQLDKALEILRGKLK